MTYLDTNIIIYSYVLQDRDKHERSNQIIRGLIDKNILVVSPLVIQELIYALAKLKVNHPIIKDIFKFYSSFSLGQVDMEILNRSNDLCSVIRDYRNFNDVVHVALAEKHTNKLITFDKDYKKFQNNCSLEIEVL
ncbi:MAG: type II toxin-antitoxin system VapC family toxin [Brevinematales bacterium]|nr:type II toxin-antitoxin system VapC family toxin [Brevinematales bacterium]